MTQWQIQYNHNKFGKQYKKAEHEPNSTKRKEILDEVGVEYYTKTTLSEPPYEYYEIVYNEGHTGPEKVYPPDYEDPNDPAVIAAEWVKDLTIPEIYLKRGLEGQTAYLQWQEANPNSVSANAPIPDSFVMNMPGPWIDPDDITKGYHIPGSPGAPEYMSPPLALQQYTLDLAKANEDDKLNSWWLAVNSPNMQRVSQEPTVQLEGATHYVNIPTDIDGFPAYAIIRPGPDGYVKAGA